MGKRIIDLVGQKFNRLTVINKTDMKSGTNYLWECQCECGNITYATSSALKTGHKKSCGCLHTEQRQALGKSKGVNLVGKTFGDLTVLYDSGERADSRIMWVCKCSCGRILNVKSSYLTQGTKTSCGCKSSVSRGEEKISEILSKANIPFVREKVFDTLKLERNLRFDFYVDNKYLIEFDGKQHFIKDSGYGSDLENIQHRDAIKNQWTLDNDIPLIRIPYTHLEQLNLGDLLLDKTDFLVKR